MGATLPLVNGVLLTTILALVDLTAAIWFIFFGVFYLPFSRHERDEHKFHDELDRLTNEITKLEERRDALVIHRARWCAQGAVKDVTEIVIQRMSNGSLKLRCDLALFGEVSPNNVKFLEIEYTYKSQRMFKSFDEYTNAILP